MASRLTTSITTLPQLSLIQQKPSASLHCGASVSGGISAFQAPKASVNHRRPSGATPSRRPFAGPRRAVAQYAKSRPPIDASFALSGKAHRLLAFLSATRLSPGETEQRVGVEEVSERRVLRPDLELASLDDLLRRSRDVAGRRGQRVRSASESW